MKLTNMLLAILSGVLFLPVSNAVTVLECVDEAGNSTFQDRCPPGATPASQREISTGTQDLATKSTEDNGEQAEGAGDADITFYTTSMECDACLVVKGLLDKYGAAYTMKDISTDMAVRKELLGKTGGKEGSSISVPTVIMDDQVIPGYNKEALIKALENAGYKKPEPPAPAPATAAPEIK